MLPPSRPLPGDKYMLRKIADGRMAPARGKVRAALPDTPHSIRLIGMISHVDGGE